MHSLRPLIYDRIVNIDNRIHNDAWLHNDAWMYMYMCICVKECVFYHCDQFVTLISRAPEPNNWRRYIDAILLDLFHECSIVWLIGTISHFALFCSIFIVHFIWNKSSIASKYKLYINVRRILLDDIWKCAMHEDIFTDNLSIKNHIDKSTHRIRSLYQ